MTQRLMPPISGANNPFTFQGRVYSCSVGSTIDVQEGGGLFLDAQTLISVGWVPCSTSGVGTTAQRPPSQAAGATFIDATLSKLIEFDGKTWRDCVSGAAV